MEKYEKPVMEVDEFDNDVIVTSPGPINQCGGIFTYGGCDDNCTTNTGAL